MVQATSLYHLICNLMFTLSFHKSSLDLDIVTLYPYPNLLFLHQSIDNSRNVSGSVYCHQGDLHFSSIESDTLSRGLVVTVPHGFLSVPHCVVYR
jgi:hypothetical protein